MFGMAMKFFQLGLQPLNIIKSSTPPQPQTTSQDTNQHDQVKRKTRTKAKSTQVIQQSLQLSHQLGQSILRDNDRDNKEITNQQGGQNITDQIYITAERLQQLKLSQQKVLQDFKQSVQRSIAFSCHHSTKQQTKLQKPQGQPYDLVQGIVLSKIEQLSEEYLEYSTRRSFTQYQQRKVGSVNIDSNHMSRSSDSCELIKSIVKSVLLPQSGSLRQGSSRFTLQNVHLKLSSVKRQQQMIGQKGGKIDGNLQDGNGIELKQSVGEFIKELFESLGLIDEAEKERNSLREITECARKRFSQLKGGDYLAKLNSMLQSVESVKGGMVLSSHHGHHINSQTSNPSHPPQPLVSNTPDNPSQPLQSSQPRKQILIKRQSQKKVKLKSPQTYTQLQSKRTLIETEITQALQFLTTPRRVKKFSFHSNTINQVIVNFSLDFKFMSYKKAKNTFFTSENFKGIIKTLCSCTRLSRQQEQENQRQQPPMTMVPLQWNLVNVAKGIKTKNFIKHQQPLASKSSSQQRLHQDRCLSLLFKNRTYDFECESQQIRDEYFRTIKIMIKSSTEI